MVTLGTVLLPVTLTVLACAGLLALASAVATARGRRAGSTLMALAACVELAVVAQLVVGLAGLAAGHDNVSAALFVAYLVGLAVIVPLAVVWARGEPSRWENRYATMSDAEKARDEVAKTCMDALDIVCGHVFTSRGTIVRAG